LAKFIANQNGLSLQGITGSGPNNRIIKSDVETALQSKSKPQPAVSTQASAPAPTSTSPSSAKPTSAPAK
jgi:pyruvate dehydrogenase E2 component (dihydrolipoamide acetyltransferase)